MVRNFRYVDENLLALSGVPESAAAVDWLHQQGIRTIVSTHPVPDEAVRRMEELEIRWLPFLIEDVSQGLPGSLTALLEEVSQRIEAEPGALMHCQGGGGRSGSMCAAYLIWKNGLTAEQALVRLPEVQKDAQKAFLHGFAAGVRSGTW